ncbi:ABC transporter permease [Caldalkalibacillus salinus]|uniref:ABC transporter permease n=1 Tax=Caldalkalibacillus salinus TaxID=2803787 RepID=UPI00192392CE|nr:ABC transporter permease [Caldalkalibacillus salinus]
MSLKSSVFNPLSGYQRSGQDAEAGAKQVKQRKDSKAKVAVIGSILPLLLIIVWESVCQLGWVAPHQLPAPSVVATATLGMVSDGSLWGHIGITVYRIAVGFIVGALAAVILGAICGLYRPALWFFDPLIQAFRSVPSLAWVPLFLLWIGIGENSKIALIGVGVFFPVYLNLLSGILSVDRKLIEVGQVYGLNATALLRRIILPACLPSLLVGLRSGLGLGWMFVVAAELLGASQGLGYLLVLGQNSSKPELIIASIVLFAALGKGTDAIIKRVEKKALHWQDNLSNQHA